MNSLTRRTPRSVVSSLAAALALALTTTLSAPAPTSAADTILEECLEAGGTYSRTCNEYKIGFGLVSVKTCTETCEMDSGEGS